MKGMGIIFVVNYLKCLKLHCNAILQGIIIVFILTAFRNFSLSIGRKQTASQCMNRGGTLWPVLTPEICVHGRNVEIQFFSFLCN